MTFLEDVTHTNYTISFVKFLLSCAIYTLIASIINSRARGSIPAQVIPYI